MTHVKEHLQKDHQQHARLLQQIARDTANGEPSEGLHQRWVAFERNLLDHLDSEDRSLFSVVAQAHRNEIEALRADHDGIRALAAEVSVAFDAGNLKSGELDALLVLLQQHAEREDQSLYQWLEDDEGICAQRGLAVMVKRYLRAAELLESHNQTDPG